MFAEESNNRCMEKSPRSNMRYTIPPVINPHEMEANKGVASAFIFNATNTPRSRLNWVKRERMALFESLLTNHNESISKAYAMKWIGEIK